MTKPTLGIIGAGRLGTALARQALRAGYEVRIANSRGPESLVLMAQVLLPGVKIATVNELAQRSDIIVLALPLHRYKMLDPALFAGKIVIDAMNYWPPTEGVIPEFASGDRSSSEYLQTYFPAAKMVKTLNHVAYHELEEHSLPAGHAQRRAVVVAGDHQAEKEQVMQLVEALGFDAVDVGPLSAGRTFQPDTPLFDTRYTREDISDER
jgi:predicted dinucleotide-binding enzyme